MILKERLKTSVVPCTFFPSFDYDVLKEYVLSPFFSHMIELVGIKQFHVLVQ